MPTTSQLPGRLSPLHNVLEHLHPKWGSLTGMPVALSFDKPAGEPALAATLGFSDASALARLTLKGPGAKALLDAQNIAIPETIFGVALLGTLGIAARTGSTEFFLEAGPGESTLVSIEKQFAPGTAWPSGAYIVRRADACILLSGEKSLDLLEQTCGYNFRGRESKLVFTRVAGVSCSILPRVLNAIPLFQLWMDGTFGVSLWETFAEIAGELGGGPVGLATYFPTLTSITS